MYRIICNRLFPPFSRHLGLKSPFRGKKYEDFRHWGQIWITLKNIQNKFVIIKIDSTNFKINFKNIYFMLGNMNKLFALRVFNRFLLTWINKKKSTTKIVVVDFFSSPICKPNFFFRCGFFFFWCFKNPSFSVWPGSLRSVGNGAKLLERIFLLTRFTWICKMGEKERDVRCVRCPTDISYVRIENFDVRHVS